MSDGALELVAWAATFLVGGGLMVGSVALYEAIDEFRIARKIGNGRYMAARSTLRAQALRASNLLSLGIISTLIVMGVEDRRLWSVLLFMYLIVSNSVDAILDVISTRRQLDYHERKLFPGEREDHAPPE